MNLAHLEVLRSLIMSGSTVAAARATGLSQSGVSLLLKSLEQEFGLSLFLREKGRLLATPEAQALAADVEDILVAVARISSRAGDLKRGKGSDGPIRVAMPISMSERFAPEVIGNFERHFPGVRVETFFEMSHTIERLIEQRVVHFKLIRIEDDLSAELAVDEVASGENVCVLPKGHRLAALEQITPKDLVGVPLILIGKHRPNRAVVDHSFARYGVSPVVKVETNTSSSACSYVAHGLGVTVVSSFYVDLFQDLPIVQRPFRPLATQRFGLARVASNPLSVAATGLYDEMRNNISLLRDGKNRLGHNRSVHSRTEPIKLHQPDSE